MEKRWVGRQKVCVCVGGVWEQLGVRDEYDQKTVYKVLKEYKTHIILKNIRLNPRMYFMGRKFASEIKKCI